MITREQLDTMARAELLAFADSQGVQVHKNFTDAYLRKAILDKVYGDPKEAKHEMRHEAERPRPVDVECTPDEVEAAIASIKAAKPAFKSEYDQVEKTWHFSCSGALESGSLCIPLRMIVARARVISHGALQMRSLPNSEWGHLGSGPGYSNAVLSL